MGWIKKNEMSKMTIRQMRPNQKRQKIEDERW